MDYYEMLKLLETAGSVEELDSSKKEILDWFPRCAVMVDYDQNNHAHPYDLWYHSLHTVFNLPRKIQDDMLFLAALLHDIGKPDCRIESAKSLDAHYYGHPERSAEIVEKDVIPFLQQRGITFAEVDRRNLLYYVRYHDDWFGLSYKHILKHLERVPLPVFQKLMHLQIADGEAHAQLPLIETHIRNCKIWLAETGDDYTQMLSELSKDEKRDVTAMRRQQGVLLAFEEPAK